MHEPIVVITQGHNQPYVVQSLGTINQQNGNFVQQTLTQQSVNQHQVIQHYSIVDEQTTECITIEVRN